MQHNNRHCVPQQTEIKNVQLAAAYVPYQKYCGIMSPMDSLVRGTAFPELFSPYRKREFANIEQEVCCTPRPNSGRRY